MWQPRTVIIAVLTCAYLSRTKEQQAWALLAFNVVELTENMNRRSQFVEVANMLDNPAASSLSWLAQTASWLVHWVVSYGPRHSGSRQSTTKSTLKSFLGQIVIEAEKYTFWNNWRNRAPEWVAKWSKCHWRPFTLKNTEYCYLIITKSACTCVWRSQMYMSKRP